MDLVEQNMENIRDICRICRCEAEPHRPLYYPCKCTGTIKYVHQDCLIRWISISNKKVCELCGYPLSMQVTFLPDVVQMWLFFSVMLTIITSFLKFIFSIIAQSMILLIWTITSSYGYYLFHMLFGKEQLDAMWTLPLYEFLYTFVHGIPILVAVWFMCLILTWVVTEPLEDLNERAPIRLLRRNLLARILALYYLNMHIHFWCIRTAVFYFAMCTLYLLCLGYGPYKFGKFLITHLTTQSLEQLNEDQVMLVLLFGQYLILLVLNILHGLKSKIWRRSLGILVEFWLTMLKMEYVMIVHWLILPTLYGFWLDVCATPIYHENIAQIVASHYEAPLKSLILHWFMGVFYRGIVTFSMWLFRQPIHPVVMAKINRCFKLRVSFDKALFKMTIVEFSRNNLVSILLMCTLIYLNLKLPIKILKHFGLLNMNDMYEFYHYILPMRIFAALMITGTCSKYIVRLWFNVAFTILGMRKCVLPERAREHLDPAAALQARLMRLNRVGPSRPAVVLPPMPRLKYLTARLCCLVPLGGILFVLTSLLFIAVDNIIGVYCIDFIMKISVELFFCLLKAHSAFYVCSSIYSGITVLNKLFKQTRAQLWLIVKEYSSLFAKYFILFGTCSIIIILNSVLCELVLFMPLQGSSMRIEVQHIKVDVINSLFLELWMVCGTTWSMKDAMQHLHNEGLERTDFKYIFQAIVIPPIKSLGILLAFPYVIQAALLQVFDNFEVQMWVMRITFLVFFVLKCTSGLLVLCCPYICSKIIEFFEKIKIEKSAARIHLVNYDQTIVGDVQNNGTERIIPITSVPNNLLQKYAESVLEEQELQDF